MWANISIVPNPKYLVITENKYFLKKLSPLEKRREVHNAWEIKKKSQDERHVKLDWRKRQEPEINQEGTTLRGRITSKERWQKGHPMDSRN